MLDRRSASPTSTVPVTYMNSTADIKGFVGRNGGVVCTSSNAKRALDWAFERGQRGAVPARPAPGPQHRGAARWASSLDDCVLYDPHKPSGGLTAEQLRDAKMILWRGHCSVHGRFTLDCVRRGARAGARASTCWCTRSAGTRWSPRPTTSARPSTSSGPSTPRRPARAWAVGTELNLVRRLANAHPDKQIMFLDRTVCYCSTMNRIDLPHLVWALEELVAGRVVNQITVRRTPPGTPGSRWTRCSRCPDRRRSAGTGVSRGSADGVGAHAGGRARRLPPPAGRGRCPARRLALRRRSDPPADVERAAPTDPAAAGTRWTRGGRRARASRPAPPGGAAPPHRAGRAAAADPPRGVPADAGAGLGPARGDARGHAQRRRALPDAPRPRPGAPAGPRHRRLPAQRRGALPARRAGLRGQHLHPQPAGEGGGDQPLADRAAAAARRLACCSACASASWSGSRSRTPSSRCARWSSTG